MTTNIQQSSTGTRSFSGNFVNIYLNILKYITNLYFFQRLEFVVVVWCLLNCLLVQIVLHKFAEMCLSLSLSLSLNFNLSVLYWHDKNYTFVLPKQLQLGCSQVVHILINRKKK